MLSLPGTESLVEDLYKISGVGKGIHRKSTIMKEEYFNASEGVTICTCK